MTADAPRPVITDPLQAKPRSQVDPDSILVAIPTFNEKAFIEQTLDMLMAERPEMERVRIVISDGGSTDGTRDIVAAYKKRHPNVALIDNPKKRQAAGVNRVVEICAEPQHRYLVRIDAHAEYPPGYVLAVVESMIEHGAQAVATVMDAVGNSCFQKGAAWAVDTKLGSGGSGHRGGTQSGWVDHGHHAGFSLDIWRRTGGYDPDYAANEDAEFDHRVRQEGGRIWLDASIRMRYYMRPNLKKLAQQYWRYGQGRSRTTLRHKVMPKLRQMIPAVAFVINILSALLSPAFPTLLLVPGFYGAILIVVTLMLVVRHRSACALWGGPALFVMHMCWGAGFVWHALIREDRPA